MALGLSLVEKWHLHSDFPLGKCEFEQCPKFGWLTWDKVRKCVLVKSQVSTKVQLFCAGQKLVQHILGSSFGQNAYEGLPLTQQTLCLKLISEGWKKEVCKSLCPLNWLSSWRGKLSLLFHFSVCAQMDLPHEQQSAVHSTLCQALSFYILTLA